MELFEDLESLLVKKPSLGAGWRIIPKAQGDPKYAAYVKRMAEELSKIPKKPKPIKPLGMSEKDFIFSLQSKSTQEIITLQEDPNYKRDWTAPLPESYLANPTAQTTEELIGQRNLSPNEISHFESRRRASKNTFGQSDWVAPVEAKNRAIDAFRSHPSIPQSHLTDEELIAIEDLKPIAKGIPPTRHYEWIEIPTWKAWWFKLIGGRPVRLEKK